LVEEQTEIRTRLPLPVTAYQTLNRCNLPAHVLGSLAFQQAPQSLRLDGVTELHRRLFESLAGENDPARRALYFQDYMDASFLLPDRHDVRLDRDNANYLRVLRGWMFSADSDEGAVIKGWVESRFGLLPRYHRGEIAGQESDSYLAFRHRYATALYNTNALEAQLDLLYSFSQYELHRRWPGRSHLSLFRGTDDWDRLTLITEQSDNKAILLLNNINAFTSDEGYAAAFGSHLMTAQIPLAKILYFPGLLPGQFQGEHEFMVIGGLLQVSRVY
tara:strand:- start:405 stop:1226 length:822 start_codon:yes stop_codon:yes gene_type:complete